MSDETNDEKYGKPIWLPSESELDRARSLPKTECPRRYCWWWKTICFDWDLTPTEGCTFEKRRDQGGVDPRWPDREFPCKRCVPGSKADHYEPREPHLLEDGFAEDRFVVKPDSRWPGGIPGDVKHYEYWITETGRRVEIHYIRDASGAAKPWTAEIKGVSR